MTSLITGFNKIDDDYFTKHFKVLDKNIEGLEEATVICLVETHYLFPVAIKNSWLIEKIQEVFLKSAYVVLVEGHVRGEVLSTAPLQAPFTSYQNTTKGWDSAEARAQTKQLSTTVHKYLITLKQIGAHVDRWRTYKDALSKMLNSVPTHKSKTAAMEDLQYLLSHPSAFDPQKLYNIFKCILSLKLFELACSITEGIKARNESFVEAHRDEIQDSKKVISIAGKLHLVTDELSKQEAIEVIKNYLRQHRYVILEANTDMESVKSVRRTLEIQQAGGKVWYLFQKIQNLVKIIFHFLKRFVPSMNSNAKLEKQTQELNLVELKNECRKFLEEFKLQISTM